MSVQTIPELPPELVSLYGYRFVSKFPPETVCLFSLPVWLPFCVRSQHDHRFVEESLPETVCLYGYTVLVSEFPPQSHCMASVLFQNFRSRQSLCMTATLCWNFRPRHAQSPWITLVHSSDMAAVLCQNFQPRQSTCVTTVLCQNLSLNQYLCITLKSSSIISILCQFPWRKFVLSFAF